MEQLSLPMNILPIVLGILCVGAWSQFSAFAQNLVANPDFEQGNSGFSSEYTYSVLSTTNRGEYSIVSDPKLSQVGNSSFGDKTSGSGLMYHANGAADTNLVIWRQTVSVSTNQLYVFSGWGANSGRSGGTSNDPNPSVLFLFVNGVALQTGAPLLATNNWAFFSRYWFSGTSNQARLEIRNGQTAGAGNDFNLDDLSFRALDSSNPTAAAAPLKTPAGIEIRWNSFPDEAYQVQWISNLNIGDWKLFGTPIPATGGTLSVSEPINSIPSRYYRVQIIQQNPRP